MTAQLLFERKDALWECALIKNGQLYDYRKEQTGILAEQIYLCKSDRVVKGMEAVFVRLTDKENGFLPYSEIRNQAIPPRSGEKILVQVKKPPIQQKCAYVTTDITLAGRYLILLPFGSKCSVSSRIVDSEKVLQLQRLGNQLKPEGMGLIMREESADAEDSLLWEERDELLARWDGIRTAVSAANAPCLIDSGMNAVERMLRDNKCPVCEIITNEPEAFAAMDFTVRTAPSPMTLFNVPGKLEKSLRRKVWLPSGGNLIIDPCEAMTVFDVNSAKDLGGKSGAEDTITRLNIEAAREIARLLRLRGIGGIVLIDFVDMHDQTHQQQVLDALEEALRDDPVKTAIHGFTSLGLLEMTRKKSSVSLTQINDIPCPHCKGTGIWEKKHA